MTNELKIYEIRTVGHEQECIVCGNNYHDVAILSTGDAFDGFGYVKVCEECFEQSELVDATLLRRAVGLEREATDLQQRAAKLRSLIGRLKLPSLGSFQGARDRSKADAA